VEDLRGHDPEIIALDGKTSRRTGDPPLHFVSAWASQQSLVLGQRAVEAASKSTATPSSPTSKAARRPASGPP
jgi:hypothetical protein